MRAGIAYYETGNYRIAERNFQKALGFNNLDSLTYEYLYYSLLYSGKEREADFFYEENLPLFSPKISQKNKKLEEIYFDLVLNTSTEPEPEKLMNYAEIEGLSGNQIIPKSFYLTSFLLRHDVSKRVSISHGGTYLRKKSFYYLPLDSGYANNGHSINQYQYYGLINFNLGHGFWINTSGHQVYYYSPPFSYKNQLSSTSFEVASYNKSSFSGNLSLNKNIWLLTLNAGIGFSKFNLADQFQQNYGIDIYPLGNLNLYGIFKFYNVSESINQSSLSRKLILFKTGFRISDKFWTEASVLSGEIKNMTLNDAYIIYNGTETITRKLDLNLIFPFRKFTFSIRTSYLDYYSDFTDSNGMGTGLNKIMNNGITINTGFQWKL
jgi:hypothetical protein